METITWDYFTPYQPDIEQALKTLQARVFKEGEYEDVTETAAIAGGSKPYAAPASIEELRRRCGDAGTRSILDIVHISKHPAPHSASPLSAERLKELFGSDKPELAEFEADFQEAARDETEMFDEIEPGQAIYIVLYKDGHPNQIFFHGASGA